MDLLQLVPAPDVAAAQKRFVDSVRSFSAVAESSTARDRIRALANVRDFMIDWQADADRRISGLDHLLKVDMEPVVAGIRKESAATRRKAAAMLQRRLADAKMGRATVSLSIRVLEERKSTRRWLRDTGTDLTAARELKLAKDIDKLSGPLRGSLERLLETMEDALDVTVVLIARLDPTNDGPAVSLDAVG